MSKRVKTTYDRGYVNAMDKIRVFIESTRKSCTLIQASTKTLKVHARLMPMQSR